MHKLPMGQFQRGSMKMKMSHLMADSDDELHAMADKIGVQRRWFQGDHYDICKSKRELAIKHGAVVVTLREMAAYAFYRRRDPTIVITPAEAAARRYQDIRDNARDPISEVVDGPH